MDFVAQPKRLYRSTKQRMFAGVLSGIAAFFHIDPTWVRLFFVFSLFVGFFVIGILAYCAAWFIVPSRLDAYE